MSLRSITRDLFRLLTYSPVALLRERKELKEALAKWNGQHLFTFPYMCIGGAEQIHVDILAAIADRRPLVLICYHNPDKSFEERFRKNAVVVEVKHLLNHPFTRRSSLQRIAHRLNAAPAPTLLSSLTDTFFDLLPQLNENVRTYHLQHAFLYQPEANTQQKRWMSRFPRVSRFIFYSGQAMRDWERFMLANNLPCDREKTFAVLPNAVQRFHAPERHERTGVLFVGRQSPVKRVELFLEITDRLEQAVPGRFRFSVAGYDGMGNHPQVKFHGRVSDPVALSALYSEHDIIVQTSTLEGYPMVIMEAVAHGLAVISTPVGDVPNQVTADFAMLTDGIEAARVVDGAVAFVQALENDRERLQRMRSAAFEYAKARYDPVAFRQRYRALLVPTKGES